METLLIEMPIPPSANHIWHTAVIKVDGQYRAQTYKSKNYKKWLVRAGRKAREQYGEDRPPVAAPCNVVVHIYGGTGYSLKDDPDALVKGTAFTAARDGDNLLKPVLDVLRAAEILRDDTVTCVPSGGWYYHGRGKKGKRARCVVEISEHAVKPTEANLFVGLETEALLKQGETK